MKFFTFLSVLSLGLFLNCSSKVVPSTTQNETLTPIQETPNIVEEEMVEVSLITDALGLDKTITARVKRKDGILKPLKFTDQTAYYIGILNYNLAMNPQSSLKMLSWEMPMTGISMMEAREPSPLVISEFDIGKLAIVRGHSNGGMIYLSNIMAVFEQKPMALLMKMLDGENFDLEEHVRKVE